MGNQVCADLKVVRAWRLNSTVEPVEQNTAAPAQPISVQPVSAQPINSQQPVAALPGTSDDVITENGNQAENVGTGSRIVNKIKGTIGKVDKDVVKVGLKGTAKVSMELADQGCCDGIPYANLVCCFCKLGFKLGKCVWRTRKKVKKRRKKRRKKMKKLKKTEKKMADGVEMEVEVEVEAGDDENDSSSSSSDDSSDSGDDSGSGSDNGVAGCVWCVDAADALGD